MKKLKIFPKTFLYSLAIMLLIVGVAHLILYLLLPQMVIDFVPSEATGNVSLTIAGKYEPAGLMKSAMLRALPLSVICCVFLSVLCAYFFSKGTTSSIRQLSKAVKKMSELDQSAQCLISSQDELGELANDVNQLYHRLLCMIENLELEKEKTSENERAKIDFLRSASHELKTPVTALNAMLENMILGVGHYQDYDDCLPECKAITERLSEMIHEILETSKLSVSTKNAVPIKINVSELLASLCEPYQLIATTHGVQFHLKIDDAVSVELPIIAVSIIILALILTLWGKTRVHETGVFLSLGIKKGNILGQYIAEVLLIAVFAFAASGITSNMFAATVADTLLQQTVQSNSLQDNAEDDTTMKSIDMGSMLEDEKAVSPDIQISVGIEDMLLLYLIGFCIIVISVTISSVSIMRLKPKNILNSMS